MRKEKNKKQKEAGKSKQPTQPQDVANSIVARQMRPNKIRYNQDIECEP